MDRILIILKKENGPRASSAPALGLNTIIFKRLLVYVADSGERLQDHWSSGFFFSQNISVCRRIGELFPCQQLVFMAKSNFE